MARIVIHWVGFNLGMDSICDLQPGPIFVPRLSIIFYFNMMKVHCPVFSTAPFSFFAKPGKSSTYFYY
ncbi:MAG: hypothetical protein QM664_14815, partial [Flavihumibacter sp.]